MSTLLPRWATALGALILPLSASGQAQAWLQWESPNVPGSIEGWVEIYGLGQGLARPTQISGGTIETGNLVVSPTSVTLAAGSLLPTMLDALSSGEPLDFLTLQIVMPSDDPSGVRVLIELRWESVLLESVQLSAEAGDNTAYQEVSFQGVRNLVRTSIIEPNGTTTSYLDLDIDLARSRTTFNTRTGTLAPGAFAGGSGGGGDLPFDGDFDEDGIPNGWETEYSLDPRNRFDADEDLDGDGLTNREEYLAGTSPERRDSRLAATIEETDGLYRVTVQVGFGRRVELRYSPTPPQNRDTEGTVIDVIEFTDGETDALVAPIPTSSAGFYWLVITLPVTS